MQLPRFDRYATLYFFYPLMKRLNNAPRVPILMYHSISSTVDDTANPYYQTTTTPDIFELQMRFLHDNGYCVVGLNEINDFFLSCDMRPRKYAVLTFDDGYMDFYANALPVLKKYHFKSTVFLPTKYVENRKETFNGRACLDWEMIKELQKDGVTFGSHTVSHPKLRTMRKPALEYEILKSKEIIEDKTGEKVASFSYPYAFPEEEKEFKKLLRSVLVESGYQNGVSTIIGTACKDDDIYFLKRLPINLYDDQTLFKAKLKGAYDWIHELQYAKKLIKSRVN